MVIPGHEFVGQLLSSTMKPPCGGDRGRRPGDLRTDRALLEVPLLQARSVLHVPAARPVRLQAAYAGRDGSYMVYPADALVHKISGDIPPAHAAFAEPLSCALHAVERAQITFEDTVVVAGCGPIGLGMVAGARAKNPRCVIALDMAPDKLALAEGCGADITINIAEEDAVAAVKDLTGRLRSRRVSRGHRHRRRCRRA